MKKIAAIFLLAIYLFSATDLKELLKVEVVIEHWHEHQKNDGSVSLYQFLVMHYVTDDHNDTDNNRDEQLPFKSHDSVIANSPFVFLPNKLISFSFQFFAERATIFFNTNDFFILARYHTVVWHPPQFS